MNLKKILVENLNPESDFGKILAIKKGTVDKTDIKFSSEYINDFDDKYMYFDFEDADNYLRYFLDSDYAEDRYGIEEIDQWVYALNYGFDGEEYLDWGSIDDEWINGYPIDALNTENKEKLDEIILLLKPDGQDFIEKSTYESRVFYKKPEDITQFLNGYGTIKDPLLDVYHDATNESHNTAATNEIQEDAATMLEPLGFESDGVKFQYYKIPLSNLALLYSRYSDNVNDDITTVLRKSADKLLKFPPTDSTWEYLSESQDTEQFNRMYQTVASEILDDAKEVILEESKNLEEYRGIYNYILKKYEFNKKHTIPNTGTDANSKIVFSVDSVDPTTNKLNVNFEKKWTRKKTKMTFSDFINILNNTRLFDFGDIFD